MPIIPQNPNPNSGAAFISNSSVTLQEIANSARAYPELLPLLTASGWTREPALTIANDVMQKFLSSNFDWKFNRQNIPPFLTVSLQQDYVTNTTNMGWLEQGWRVDINNTSTPKPVFTMEAVRDLGRTSFQANSFNLSWVPNRLAIMGTWVAATSYPSGLNQPFTPSSPVQQFVDSNGNILYVTTNGISGNSQPSAPSNSVPGVTVTDGTVVWTVADPNGIAIRLSPLPNTSGIVWQINPVYQVKAPKLTSLTNTIAPIPDDYAYLFRRGFIAACKEHANTRDARDAYMKWEEDMNTALRAADRELESNSFYPTSGLMSGSAWGSTLPIGPAFPYDYSGGY